MRANMWSRVLVVLSLFSFTVRAEPPVTHEPGTRVTVKLAVSSGELPEPEKLVKSLEAVGGEHLVRVQRHKSTEQDELTLDLWGNFVPQADIPQTLRETFPALAKADIQVTTLDPNDRPNMRRLRALEKELDGEPGTGKRVIKIIKKEEKKEE
jgi:hypothetical protein